MSKTVSIEQYMANLQKVINDQPNKVKRIVLANMDDIVDYNREEQLYKKGIDIFGNTVGNYRQNRIGGSGKGYPKFSGASYNFYDSGGLFNSMYVVYKGKYHYEIVSNVSYLKDIFETVNNKNLIGLTQENAINVDKEIIKPDLDKWILSIL